ncbi:efflux RND transporter periplasmic adaptor subunit [Moraxella sp. ZY210820]|uniref:efflux RND transporter periplasmic adaptor subunit n=1 Tax=unclassified Moraxella TaxID=2685852 RepID=UPI0027310BCF|nr:efflux RND transporter periplasmic adaptor subunit [Moraxella sp. ZY210820]
MIKRPSPILTACALAVSLALVGCGDKESKTDAQTATTAEKPAPEVGVIVAQAQTIENFTELKGRASAYEVAQIRPQATGVILKRLFAEGSFVKAGQALYELDSRTNRASAENAHAAVLRSQANLNALRTKENRYRQLVGTNAISKQEYDDIVAQVRLAEADLAASKASLKSAEVNLGYSTIRSPISGRVGESNVTVGALVTNGQGDALVTVQRLDPIYIDITQSSADLLRLRREIAQGNVNYNGNANVKLTLEDGSTYPLEGKLAFAGATVNEATGAVTLRAIFPNPQHILLPGMYATAKISQGVLNHAYLVPQTALTRNPLGKAVIMVVNNESKVVAREVETSGTQGTNWIVTQGLADGDKVIVTGIAKIKAGDTVKANLTSLAELAPATTTPTPIENKDTSATTTESSNESVNKTGEQTTATTTPSNNKSTDNTSNDEKSTQ